MWKFEAVFAWQALQHEACAAQPATTPSNSRLQLCTIPSSIVACSAHWHSEGTVINWRHYSEADSEGDSEGDSEMLLRLQLRQYEDDRGPEQQRNYSRCIEISLKSSASSPGFTGVSSMICASVILARFKVIRCSLFWRLLSVAQSNLNLSSLPE